MTKIEPIVDAFRGQQYKPTVILLVATPLMLVWKYYGSPETWDGWVSDSNTQHDLLRTAYHFLSCFVLLGVIPALLVRMLFGEKLRDYGVGLGDWRFTLTSFLGLAPFFLAVSYLGSGDAALLEEFPLNPRAGQSGLLFSVHAVTYLMYYIGWEFFFRGLLLFGLRDALGAANAVLIQTLASALLHIGGPASETFAAILAGLLWGMLALQTGSLVSGLGLHYLLGLSLDAFICLR